MDLHYNLSSDRFRPEEVKFGGLEILYLFCLIVPGKSWKAARDNSHTDFGANEGEPTDRPKHQNLQVDVNRKLYRNFGRPTSDFSGVAVKEILKNS